MVCAGDADINKVVLRKFGVKVWELLSNYMNLLDILFWINVALCIASYCYEPWRRLTLPLVIVALIFVGLRTFPIVLR